MLKFLFKRLLILIPVTIIISILIFFLVSALPGDPTAAYIDPNHSSLSPEQMQAQKEEIIQRLGLDQPVYIRYIKWVKATFQEKDLGTSLVYNEKVTTLLPIYIKNSLILNLTAFIITYIIAIPVAIISATKRGKLFDRFWQVFSVFGISLPSFFIAMILIYIVGIKLDLLPLSGMVTAGYNHTSAIDYIGDVFEHMILPLSVLVILQLAGTIRYIRNAMVDVIKQDYIRTARSKGLSEKVVIYSHAFRNVLIPVVTLLFLALPGLFAGSVVLENIFIWPGVGSILIEAISKQDNAIIISITLFYAVLTLISNILMDIGYALVDPRVRL